MMDTIDFVWLFGAARCSKCQFYIQWLDKQNVMYKFLDVEKSEQAADQLRNLYQNKKLNFPTFLIRDKKLRNPSLVELEKWLIKKDIPFNNEP